MEIGAFGRGAGVSAVDATDWGDLNPAAPNQKRADAQKNLKDRFNFRVILLPFSGVLLLLMLRRRKSGDSSFPCAARSTEGYVTNFLTFLICADGEGVVKATALATSKFRQIVNFTASFIVVVPFAKILCV